MNILDVLVVIAFLFSLLGGYRRGFWLTLAQYAGVLGGFIVGARFAPDAVDWLGIDDPAGRQLAAFVVLLAASSIGGSVGFGLAGPLRRWLLTRRMLGVLDSLAGAGLSGAVTLAMVWFLAMMFARGPIPDLARVIQQSAIVKQLDAAVPQPPAFLAKVQQVLSGTFLPSVFAGLEPDLPAPATPSPDAIATDGVRAAAAATVRVQGLGCGGIATGSGFVVEDGLIVTNAHVVSGTTGITISPPQGDLRPTVVVFFDPERDLAILRAPDLGIAGLAPGDARPGAIAAVLGYPGGGPLQISPAVIERRFSATGRDIYNRRMVVRDIWSVSARVSPGNSGGPVVDQDGRYVAAIFAASVSNPGHAYGLVANEIVAGVQQATSEPAAIDTRRLPCVR